MDSYLTTLVGTSRFNLISVQASASKSPSTKSKKKTWNPVARQKDLQTLARLEVTPTSDPIEARRSLWQSDERIRNVKVQHEKIRSLSFVEPFVFVKTLYNLLSQKARVDVEDMMAMSPPYRVDSNGDTIFAAPLILELCCCVALNSFSIHCTTCLEQMEKFRANK